MTTSRQRRRTCTACGVEKGHLQFYSSSPVCKVCQKKQTPVRSIAPELEKKLNEHVVGKVTKAALEKIAVEEAREALQERRRVSAVQKELAARLLSRRRLLPFIQRMNPEYLPGWAHEHICRRLEAFERDIAAKKSPRLIICLPPRFGKSEIGSRSFPAWFLGLHPEWEVVGASHTGSLALSFSRKVRETVRSDAFRTTFEGCHLDPDSQALENWSTTRGGSFTAVGVGGSLTGKGAHCFPKGTRILTETGERPVESIAPGDLVLAYDHHTHALCWKPTQAVAHRQAAGLFRVTTAAGRVVEATADHPFYANGRYTVAAELASGDRLVCAVRQREPARGVRAEQALLPRARGVLLRAELLERAPEPAAPRGAGVLDLQQAGAEGELPRHGSAAVLLEGVHGGGRGAPQGAGREVAPRESVPDAPDAVQSEVLRQERRADVLLPPLRGHRAPEADVWPVQPEVQVRGVAASGAAAFGEGVPGHAPCGPGAGRAQVRGVPGGGHSAGGAPHRQLADEQRLVEPRDALLEVPSGLAFGDGFEAVEDTVALVEALRPVETGVYDLQVADTHNFFAEGILVHNCLIIDDPVKDMESAMSEVIRSNTFDWYSSVARTRIAPGGGLLIIMTLWHDDDLVGRLTAAMGDGGEEFEIIKYAAINDGYDEYLTAEDTILRVFPGETVPEGARLMRAAGTAIHPDRYPTEEMLRLKKSLISTGQARVWSALYQQNPVPDDGAYFEKGMFQYLSTTPDVRGSRIIQAWDFAITEKQSADWTVGVTMAQTPEDQLIVLDVRRFRSGDSIVIVDTMLDYFAKWGAFTIGVEDGQIWRAMSAIFAKRCRERKLYPNIHLNKPLTDKMVRASPLRGRMQMGNVVFPKDAPWLEALQHEMLRFPAGKHDDQIDGLAWCVHTAMAFPPTQGTRARKFESWRDKLRGLGVESGTLSHMTA